MQLIILFCVVLIVLIIVITIFSKSKSPFGNTVSQRILIESSDVVGTSFTLVKTIYTNGTVVELSMGDKNKISTKYQNKLEDYLNYLKSNLSQPGSINVIHYNLHNVLNDYNNVMIPDQYFPKLGTINCTDANEQLPPFSSPILSITDTTISVSPTPDVSYNVTLQSGSFLAVALSTYIDYDLYNKPTVYQYVDDGTFSGSCAKDVTSCGENNIILGSKCSGCDLNLVVNGIVPPGVEVPLLQVHNGITLSTSPDFIDKNGISCYLIPNLFNNNVTLTIPNAGGDVYGTVIAALRDPQLLPPTAGKNGNYLTRFEAVPGSYECLVLYYTTLDIDTYAYVSDSAVIVNGPDIYGPYTNTDPNNKFSDKHIKLTGGNCKNTYQCTSTTSINFGLDIILPNGTIISIGGKDGELQDKDFGYLYAFAFIPNCQINFHIKGDDSSVFNYSSGTETFPLNNCLTKNLSSINLSYEYNPRATGMIDTHYMKAYADLFDTSGNNILSKSTGHSSNTDTSGC